jgi:hypothetical protein
MGITVFNCLLSMKSSSFWSAQPRYNVNRIYHYSRSLLASEALVDYLRILVDLQVLVGSCVRIRGSRIGLSSHRSLQSRSGTS